MRNKRGPKIELQGTPQNNLPGDENSLPTVAENNLFVRYDLNHCIVGSEKPKQCIFLRECHGQLCQKLFEDRSESFQSSNLFQI